MIDDEHHMQTNAKCAQRAVVCKSLSILYPVVPRRRYPVHIYTMCMRECASIQVVHVDCEYSQPTDIAS